MPLAVLIVEVSYIGPFLRIKSVTHNVIIEPMKNDKIDKTHTRLEVFATESKNA